MSILQFNLRESPLMPITWQDRLNFASSEAEVVEVAKDFIAQFTPEEIHELPEACRPGKFFDANDVTSYAFALVRHNCDGDARVSVLVHKMVAFFSEASIRLSKIMAADNASQADSRQSA
ncbi:MAG TPA: hypothetical protein VM122_11620 [Usitatibacter sp.]|nr:hypothetical protein [Usitatibacter sp.]